MTISMSTIIRSIVVMLTITLFSCKREKSPPPLKRPNVVFILTDQWRSSAFGFNGNDIVKTPYLDAFSKEAVNFRNAVSVTPVCTPFRASLMTGKYPTSTGMFINDLYLPSEEYCMAEIYGNAGYNTAYLGKWHLDGHGRTSYVAPDRRQGWQQWKGAECDHNYWSEHYFHNDDTTKRFWEGYSTYAIAKEAEAYMESFVGQKEPFFLFVSIATPHFPHHTAPEAYKQRYDTGNLALPPNVPVNRRQKALVEMQGYYAHATATDSAIGGIIDKVKELDILDNTIIIFTTDHGEMMGAHDVSPLLKQQPYSEAANVPFLVSYPGIGKNAGSIAQAPITTPDILPSLLSLCDIEVPKGLEGYDLSSIMKEPETGKDRAALYMNLCPFGRNYGDEEFRAIQTARYRYIKTHEGPYMLFDIQNDPYEMENLIDSANLVDVQKELDQKLMEELQRIGEEDILPRAYYLEKFGYYGRKEFRDNYHIDELQEVETVITPNGAFRIRD